MSAEAGDTAGDEQRRRRRRRGGRNNRDDAPGTDASADAPDSAPDSTTASDEASAARTDDSPATADGQDGEVRDGGPRRRGRGRDRQRRDEAAGSGDAQADLLNPGVASAPGQAAAAPAAPIDAVADGAVATPIADAQIVEAAPAAIAAAPAPVSPAASPPAAPAAESAPASAAAARVIAPFVLPLDELQRIAEGSGLQWVNSDSDKIRAAQAAMAAEPASPHVPRLRPARVLIDEGPLVLVETRKDLSQLKLPFEQQAAAGPQA